MTENSLDQLLDQLDADTAQLTRLAGQGDWESFARHQQRRDARLQALDAAVTRALRQGSHSEAQLRRRLLGLREQNQALAMAADQAKESLERHRAALERSVRAVKSYQGIDKT